MKIEHLNATFQPAKIGNPHGLQITYLKDNSTRNIFVYHEDGKVRARRWQEGLGLAAAVDAARSQPVAPRALTERGVVGWLWKGWGYRRHNQL